jgi:membrane associated rhomboid family serine protease
MSGFGACLIDKFGFRLARRFSHTSFLHLGINMYALWSFSPMLTHVCGSSLLDFRLAYLVTVFHDLLQAFTAPQFATVYLASGLAGAIASNSFHAISRIHSTWTLEQRVSELCLVVTMWSMRVPQSRR